jgi:hypothetical protein
LILIRINTLKDIKSLTVNQKFKEHLISYFKELFKSLGQEEKLSEFSLKKHGPITILRGAKDLQEEKLLQSWPEYIEKLRLDGKVIYRVFILRTNDYVEIYYFFPQGELPEEILDWIEKNSAYECDLESQDSHVPF